MLSKMKFSRTSLSVLLILILVCLHCLMVFESMRQYSRTGRHTMKQSRHNIPYRCQSRTKTNKADRPYYRFGKVPRLQSDYLLCLLLVAAGILGVYLFKVYRHTKEMVSFIQQTDVVGTNTKEVVQTLEEDQGDYLNLLVVGIVYDDEATDRDYGSPEHANTDVIFVYSLQYPTK